MEFFNTCAGSQLATAIGLEVINIIEEEKLMQNALQLGGYMKKQLIKLKDKY
jgi:4-aminobutyrate aminotransferase-like enzyme